MSLPPPSQSWAKTSKAAEVFFVRMNNSTRGLAAEDVAAYVASRGPH